MAEPTAAAMHLAKNVPKKVFKGELVELYSTPKALEFIARALDEAGVAEAVKGLTWLVEHYLRDDSVIERTAKSTIRDALAALTGTVEEVDGGG